MSQPIDLNTWPRRHVYAMYRAMENPFVSITAPVDITALKSWCKAEDVSLFATALHALTLAANQVPELRVRIRETPEGDALFSHHRVDPAFTVPAPNGLFNFGTVPLCNDPVVFAHRVAALGRSLANQTELTPFDDLRDDVFYLSCLPWMAFTQVSHPVHSSADCTPRIAWGKVTRQGDKWTCPVNIQVHHGLADGSHLGAFFDAAQRQFNAVGD